MMREGKISTARGELGQFHRNLLVEDFADGQGHDHLDGAAKEAAAMARSESVMSRPRPKLRPRRAPKEADNNAILGYDRA